MSVQRTVPVPLRVGGQIATNATATVSFSRSQNGSYHDYAGIYVQSPASGSTSAALKLASLTVYAGASAGATTETIAVGTTATTLGTNDFLISGSLNTSNLYCEALYIDLRKTTHDYITVEVGPNASTSFNTVSILAVLGRGTDGLAETNAPAGTNVNVIG